MPGGSGKSRVSAAFDLVFFAAAVAVVVAILVRISSKSWRADWTTLFLVRRPR